MVFDGALKRKSFSYKFEKIHENKKKNLLWNLAFNEVPNLNHLTLRKKTVDTDSFL